jgi:ribosomal protein S18 acetylase RimI-like enzyme
MSESGFMPQIKLLVPGEWPLLRDMRLAALRESPHAFLATYDNEKAFDEPRWRAEFARGDWIMCLQGDEPTGIVGCTREADMPTDECYLEYLWVAPEWRNKGVARTMVTDVLDYLRKSGMRRAYLWVLDGNDAAVRLYKSVGFVSSNNRQPLEERPGRTEERMQFNLR